MTAPADAVATTWWWDWVPDPDSGPADRAAWIAAVTARLDEWVGAKVAAAREAWTAGDFPFAVGSMGDQVTRALLERAATLPGHARLLWGAGFLNGEARWLPVLLLVEFRVPLPGDSAYLMATVGAEGRPDDVREPVIEYVSTDHGDGVQVFALVDNADEGLHARVEAALRLESFGADVLISTKVTALDQMPVIGAGLTTAMTMIDASLAAGPVRLPLPAEDQP
ncbi:hypothetical protein [Actinoplanes sp. NBRC 101535]|uniref:hypothetical protein n=1 Tax=Actinoplanes sp. NBRC 101535 TaxID=3032196 RepID=UPI0024A3F4AC|nr:hypothetical protein [Actinoplanes sp. NBRC 101535]GLY02351.1 hypothetical protein Acsp01_27300 [Actinoplanes sp. NBRC 101535]